MVNHEAHNNDAEASINDRIAKTVADAQNDGKTYNEALKIAEGVFGQEKVAKWAGRAR